MQKLPVFIVILPCCILIAGGLFVGCTKEVSDLLNPTHQMQDEDTPYNDELDLAPHQPTEPPPRETEAPDPHQTTELPNQTTESPIQGIQEPDPLQPVISPQDGLSLMVQVLAYYAQPTQSLLTLQAYLEASGQLPRTQADESELIGNVYTVYTLKPPLGTRYFVARYFSESIEDNPHLLQMSFEYKPGPNSMKEAIAAIEQAFPSLEEAITNTEDFTQWELDDTYLIWLKKLDAYDLIGHPTKAYAPEDLGTIIINIERLLGHHLDE